jgi:hypothetical protein
MEVSYPSNSRLLLFSIKLADITTFFGQNQKFVSFNDRAESDLAVAPSIHIEST